MTDSVKNLYADLIQRKAKKLSEIPVSLREDVRKILEDREYEFEEGEDW